MSDETTNEPTKRTRKANPFSVYSKAKHKADVARRAAARADELHAKAEEAAKKAAEAKAKLPELEAAEQAAYTALQEALKELDTDTDKVADEVE